MQRLKQFKEILMKEIAKVNTRGELLPTEIHPLYEVIDMIKDIETICAMKEYGEYPEEEGSSYGRAPVRYNYPRDTWSGKRGMRINDRYSRGTSNMHAQIEEMIDQTSNPEIREALIRCARTMEEM